MVLQRVFIIGKLLCFFKLMVHGLVHDFCCMGISLLVPVVCGVQKLAPCWWSLPVLVHVVGGLHETSDRAMIGALWLFLCQLKSCFELLPQGWITLLPGLGGRGGIQWFLVLGLPRVFL